MYNIAIFETSTELGSCAININGNIFAKFCPPSLQKHSQSLLPLFEQLLHEQNLLATNLQAIAFGAGPGAFSGLRFSVATAQAFSMALNIPAIPVNSALTLVFWAIKYLIKKQQNLQNLPKDFQIFSVLDARMNEIYITKFTFNNFELSTKKFLQNLVENYDNSWFERNIQLLKLNDLKNFLQQNNQQYSQKYLVGNIAKLLDDSQKAEITKQYNAEFLPEIVPQAQEVGEIAGEFFLQGKNLQTPEKALPIYIRNKVAETTEERMKKYKKI